MSSPTSWLSDRPYQVSFGVAYPRSLFIILRPSWSVKPFPYLEVFLSSGTVYCGKFSVEVPPHVVNVNSQHNAFPESCPEQLPLLYVVLSCCCFKVSSCVSLACVCGIATGPGVVASGLGGRHVRLE